MSLKRINYTNLMPDAGAVPEEGRALNSISPITGGPYDSTQAGRVLTFHIPSSNFLDTGASYLRFKAAITTSANRTAGTAGQAEAIMFDGVPAASLIQSVSAFSADGTQLSHIENFGMSFWDRVHSKSTDFATLAARLMGYNPVFESEIAALPSDTAGQGFGRVLARDASNKLAAASLEAGYPCAVVYDGTATTPTAGSQQTAEFVIPLGWLVPAFDVDKLVPMSFIGNSQYAVRLDIRLATASQALICVSTETTALTRSTLLAQTNPGFVITEPALVLENVSIAEDLRQIVGSAIMSNGVMLQYTDLSTNLSEVGTTSTSYTDSTSKTTVSLKNLTVSYRRQPQSENRYVLPLISGTRRFGLNSVWFQFSGVPYPSAPLQIQTGFSAGAYAELVKTKGALTKAAGSGWSPEFQNASKNGFIVAMDFDSKSKYDEAGDHMVAGKNLSKGQSQLTTLIQRSGDSTPIQLFYTFETDNVLMMRAGAISTLEQR